MEFFAPALQTTLYFCGLPVIFIALLITLAFIIFRRKQLKNLTMLVVIRYFLMIVALCFTICLVAIWLFTIVGTEPLH